MTTETTPADDSCQVERNYERRWLPGVKPTDGTIAHADDHASVQCPHCDQLLCGAYPPGWWDEETVACERAEAEWDHVDECAKRDDPLMEALDAPETYAGPTSISPRTVVAPAKRDEDAR